ncbi:MAG: dihydrodipicolinate synthase family protein [Pseudomonadota bacterium]
MSAPIDRHSRGVFIIAATPFAENGALDSESADSMVDFYRGTGVDGITILGVMGEAPKLSAEESLSFAQRVIARAGLPVIVGVSGGGLDPMRRLAHEAMNAGAAGVMVAPPAGTGPEDRVEAYFTSVCAALGPDVPICLQDYPALTGVKISATSILRLTSTHPQIVMLKHEDWPGLNKLTAVRRGSDTAEVPRLSILTGNSALFLDEEMARGADGAMTGFCFPEMLVEVVAAHASGARDRASDLFEAYLPLIRYEQQPSLGLAIRKEVLRRRGAIASSALRAPGPRLTPEDVSELERLLDRLDTRLKELG